MPKALDQELKRIKSAGLERRFPYSANRAEGMIDIAGRKVVDFTNFDYLNLSRNQKVIRAAHQAIEAHGISHPSSRTSSGASAELISAENRLARFMGVEGSIFFSSRNQALLSLLAAVVGQGELLAFDESAYAPIADASLLLEATPLPFSFERSNSLDSTIERASVTPLALYCEAISPLRGDVFPLTYLQGALSVDARLNLIFDESYSLAAMGERGAGAFEASGAIFPNIAFVGSFGFGIPGFGGFVAGGNLTIEYIRQTSKAIESESPIPAGTAAAIEAAIDLVELDIIGRKKLKESIRRFRAALGGAGVGVTGSENSPVIGIPAASFSGGRDIVARLLARGVLIELVALKGFRKEMPILRIVLSSAHSHAHLDQLIELIVESCKPGRN